MNIVLVCSSYGGGGAERVAANLAMEFCERKFRVFFYYWDDQHGQTYPIHSWTTLTKPRGRSLVARIVGLRRLLSNEPIDAIIGFTDIANIVCWGSLLGRLSHPTFVATVHSDLRVRDEHLGLSLKNRVIRWAHKRACRKAKNVVAVSNGSRLSLVEYYDLQQQSVVRIYNPVLEKVKARAAKSEIGWPLHLVAAGRLTKAKNYPLMIRAVRLVKDTFNVPCLLSIYGEGELRPEIERLIDELDLRKVVVLHGYERNLTAKLSQHDIFLMSSSWEGFGNVLVEALDEGLRIVATDCRSGPREILNDGKYGTLTRSDDLNAMAEAIVRVSQETPPFSRIELRQHLENFTIANAADQYCGILGKVEL